MKNKTNKYTEDIERINDLLIKNNFNPYNFDAYKIWSTFSEDYCAGWLYLPESDEKLLKVLIEYGNLEGMNKKRTKDLKELSDIFLAFGKQDIRVGQAIYNAMYNQDIDLYNIENDKLLELLKKQFKGLKNDI